MATGNEPKQNPEKNPGLSLPDNPGTPDQSGTPKQQGHACKYEYAVPQPAGNAVTSSDNAESAAEENSEQEKTDHSHAMLPAWQHPFHLLALENLTVTRSQQNLIENVSLHIHCGNLVALIGPNGGGKSTLLKAIIGEIPSTGTIRFGDTEGKTIQRPRIGYMPQQLLFDRQSPLTVADFLAASGSRRPVFFGLSQSRRNHVLKLLAQVEAENLLDKRLGDLSGGELQRVSLAFALDPIPDILLLDEPVAALDKTGRALFYKLVAQLRERYDLLTLIVSHEFNVVKQYATHAYYLDRTIRAGGPISWLESDPQTAQWFAAIKEEA